MAYRFAAVLLALICTTLASPELLVSEDDLMAALAEEDCFEGCGEGGTAALALVQNFAAYRRGTARQAAKQQALPHEDSLMAALQEEDGVAPALSLLQEVATVKRVPLSKETKSGHDSHSEEPRQQAEKGKEGSQVAAVQTAAADVVTGPGAKYSIEDVGKHTSRNDLWMVVHGKVLDVSKYVNAHPGGAEALLRYAGKDATKTFDMIHPAYVMNKVVPEFVVGELQPHSVIAPKLLEEDCQGSECGTALVQQSVTMKTASATQTPRRALMAVGADGLVEDTGSFMASSAGSSGLAHMSVAADSNVVFY